MDVTIREIQNFHDLLKKNTVDWTDSAYVATKNSGQGE